MLGESQYAILLSALLFGASLLVLAMPLLRIIVVERGMPSFALFSVPVAGLALVGATVASLITGDPILLAPLVVAIVLLRALSPTLTFLKVREALEPNKMWYWVKAIIVAGFIAMPAYLAFRLIVPSNQSDAFLLGERVLMALGGALVLIRFYMLLLPRIDEGRLYLLISAILFSVSLGVIAPYAFPGYQLYYGLSGIVGWCLGLVFAFRSV